MLPRTRSTVTHRRILIVSGDDIVADELAQQLTSLGYECSAAAAAGPDAVLHVAAPANAGSQAAGPARAAAPPVDTIPARELEDRFFAVSIDMLCFLDFDGHFKRLNAAWERTLGFSREELMARPFIEFVHPDDRERTLKQNASVRAGSNAVAFENRYLCKDGSHRWLRWNAAPDSDENVIYSVARDITASKQAEEEREQLVRELQAALTEVNTLRDILPICSYCRRIRDDENYWHSVEGYIAHHTSTQFSHGICPSCMDTLVETHLGDAKGR